MKFKMVLPIALLVISQAVRLITTTLPLAMLSFCLLFSLPAWSNGESNEPITSELTWADKNELERKTRHVEDLGRRHFGRGLRNDKSDLDLLQRIADKKIIKADDTMALQALGVAFGNVLQQELALEWVVYQDSYGRNRAVCVKNTSNCAFPLTSLSKRLEAGLSVDVHAIYDKTFAALEPFVEDNNAYDGVKEDPTPKPSWTKKEKKQTYTIPIR